LVRGFDVGDVGEFGFQDLYSFLLSTERRFDEIEKK